MALLTACKGKNTSHEIDELCIINILGVIRWIGVVVKEIRILGKIAKFVEIGLVWSSIC
jgi:hypothetical protein